MEETPDSEIIADEAIEDVDKTPQISEIETALPNDVSKGGDEVKEAEDIIPAAESRKMSLEVEDVLPTVEHMSVDDKSPMVEQEEETGGYIPLELEKTDELNLESDDVGEDGYFDEELDQVGDVEQQEDDKNFDEELDQVGDVEQKEGDKNFDEKLEQAEVVEQKQDEQPPHFAEQLSVKEAIPAESGQGKKAQGKPRAVRMEGAAQPAEVRYKAASSVIRDPTKPFGPCRYRGKALEISVRGAKDVSNRRDVETLRQDMQESRTICRNQWLPNPACTVPMPVTGHGRRSRVKTEPKEEWRVWEARDKERRDHELAMELGYETLVGNILYIDIPGGRDINRSWQNFLSEDVLEWGFPYKKGSVERPRMKLPDPYLAHQVKEKLWKFPRSRTLQSTQED